MPDYVDTEAGIFNPVFYFALTIQCVFFFTFKDRYDKITVQQTKVCNLAGQNKKRQVQKSDP